MPTQTGHNQARVTELYNELRAVPWTDWTEQTCKSFLDRHAATVEMNETEAKGSISLLARAAQESTQEQFTNCLSTGEIPPMKLSDEEMKVVRGGAWWNRIVTYLWKKTLEGF